MGYNRTEMEVALMLLQFNFKNFKSFRDDATLDLTATKITEYSNHVVSIANERVLPVAAAQTFWTGAGRSQCKWKIEYTGSLSLYAFV